MMNTKNFIRSLLMCSAILVAWSCTREDSTSPVDNPKELTINYEISGVDKAESAATRTVGSVQENQVNTIYTLFFNPNTEEFVGITSSLANHDASTGKGTIRAVMPGGTYVDDRHKLLFLANFAPYADLGGDPTVEAYLSNLLQGQNIEWAKSQIMAYATSTSGLKAPFLMSYELDKPNGTNVANVKFQRNAVRFDLHNSAAKFELVSAEVRNARKSTTAADTKYYGTGGASDYVNYTGNKPTTLSNQISGKLYAFENMVMTPTNNDNKTTCLIVGGKYDGSSTVTYYRVNVCAAGAQQLLMRNNVYVINLKEVTAAGSADETTAYNDPNSHIKCEVNKWEDNFNTTYVFDKDGNGLAVSQRYVSFGDKGGISVEIEVKRLDSSTNKIVTDWSIEPLAGTDAVSFKAIKKLLDSSNKYITVSALTDNSVTVERTASFNVVWGDLKVPVSIVQLSTATSESGIKAVPANLVFPKLTQFLEVGVDLQGRFTGITQANIQTSIQYELGSGWLTVAYSRTDATTKIVYYKVTTTSIVSTSDFTRDADIKFSVIQGLTIMTCKAHVRQTTISVLPEQDFSQLRVTVERKKGATDLGTAPYIDMGGIGIAYKNEFVGFPADCPATEGNLQFAINDKAELQYNLGIISKMAWTIVQDEKVSNFVNFSKTSGAAGIGAETFVTITAKKDAVADTQLIDGWQGWTGWSGTFKVLFENGTQKEYTIHQKGVIKRYVNPTNTVSSDTYRMYYYKAFMMFGKMWLDRNIGVTTSDIILATDTDTRKGQGNTADPNFTLGEANQNGGLCPAGFHIPTNAEWTPLQLNYVNLPSIVIGSNTHTPQGVKYSDAPLLYWQIPEAFSYAPSGTVSSVFFLTSTLYSYFIANATYVPAYWIYVSNLGIGFGVRQLSGYSYVGTMELNAYSGGVLQTQYGPSNEIWVQFLSPNIANRTTASGVTNGRGVVRCVQN